MLNEEPIIRYLNTDLDLVAATPLQDLTASFQTFDIFPLHVAHRKDGLWCSTLETEKSHVEAETNIAEMLTAIESLPESVLKVWNDCKQREFNIGYDCGDEPWEFSQGLSNETLRRMAACGSTFRLTLYPFREIAASQDEQ